jgi:hypothetical protein
MGRLTTIIPVLLSASLWHVILKGKGIPDHWYPYQKSVRKTRVMRERAAEQVMENHREILWSWMS